MNQNDSRSGANQLRQNSLGVGAITFLVVSAAAPLTAVAGGVPLAMLLGNGAGIPAAFLLVTLILLLFAVGYVAMSRYITRAGAFYTYTTTSFGGIWGSIAALIAILAYNCMQIGLYGLFGAATAGLFSGIGLELPWWVWTYLSIAIVAFLGYRSIDLSTKILGLLVLAEYVIVLIIDVVIAMKGGAQGISLSSSFSPSAFFSGAPAIGMLFCFAAFIGFESTTIYREEARDATITVPRATYISVLIIGVFYMLTSWMMVVGEGADKLIPTLQGLADPTTFLFGLAERYVGGWAPPIMSFLLVTSLFAGILAFHNAVARYMYVAGRSGILPTALGKTHSMFQSPYIASIVQTLIATLVVSIFVIAQLDPVLALFSWLTNVATLAILVLMCLTALAIFVFFKQHPELDHSVLATKISPIVSGLLLIILVVFITWNFASIAGTNSLMAVFLPSLIIIAGFIGWILALRLRATNPRAFADLGSR